MLGPKTARYVELAMQLHAAFVVAALLPDRQVRNELPRLEEEFSALHHRLRDAYHVALAAILAGEEPPLPDEATTYTSKWVEEDQRIAAALCARGGTRYRRACKEQQMSTVGSLAISVFADASAFTKTMAAAGKTMQNFGKMASGVNAFKNITAAVGTPFKFIEGAASGVKDILSSIPIVGAAFALVPTSGAAFSSWLKQGMNDISEMYSMSVKLGISTERMGVLMAAAGGNAEALFKGFQHFARTMGEVEAGTKGAGAPLVSLGLDPKAIAAMKPDEGFITVMEKIRQIEIPAKQAAALFAVLGKNGLQLGDFMRQGAAGVAAMEAKMKQMGLTVSSIDAAKVVMAQKAIGAIEKTFVGIQRQLAVQFAPLVQMVAEGFSKMLETARPMGEVVEEAFQTGVQWIGVFLSGLDKVIDAIGDIGKEAIKMIKEVKDNMPSAWLKWFQSQAAGKAPEGSDWQPAMTKDDYRAQAMTKFLGNVPTFFGGTAAGKGSNIAGTFLEKLTTGAKALAEAFDRAKRGVGSGGGGDWDPNWTALLTKMDGFFGPGGTLASGYEKFSAAVVEFRDVWEQGAGTMTDKDFGAGLLDALEKLPDIAADKLPTAMVEGSREALSAEAKFGGAGATSPLENLLARADAAAKRDEERNKLMAQLVEAFKAGRIVLKPVAM